MRLTLEALEEALNQRKLSSCYLLVSREPFLLQETRDSIWKIADQKGFSDRMIWEKPNINWELLQKAASHSDLFHKPFLELRFTRALDSSTGNKLAKWITASQGRGACSPIIVVSFEEWMSKLQRNQWFQQLASMSTLVAMENLALQQYWVNKQLSQAQLKLTQSALSMLIQFTEGNLVALKQTIKKLSFVDRYLNTTLDIAELKLFIEDQGVFELSHLTEAILQGKVYRCARIIKYFEGNNTPCALVLGCLVKTLRIVSNVRDGLENNSALSLIFEKHGVWSKQQAGFRKVAETLSKDKVIQLFRLAHHIDRCIKGVLKEPSWRYLEQLSLSLADAKLFAPPLQYS